MISTSPCAVRASVAYLVAKKLDEVQRYARARAARLVPPRQLLDGLRERAVPRERGRDGGVAAVLLQLGRDVVLE